MYWIKINRLQELRKWHEWFAWYPVPVFTYPDGSKKKVWLKKVKRCMGEYFDQDGNYYEKCYKE